MERAILRALGTDRYTFTVGGPRTRIVSDLSNEHERTKAEESRRPTAARSDG